MKTAEILALSGILGAVNAWFFPSNPGFLRGFFNPYTVVSLLVAVSYGKYYAFLSLAASAAAAVGGMAVLGWRPVEGLGTLAAAAAALSLVEAYALGSIRDVLALRERRASARLSSFSRTMGLMKREVRALESVNGELEERLSRQRDNVTSLYSQMQVLSSLNLPKAFGAILEMVRRFVGASRCSIWEHKPESKTLILAASLGGEEIASRETALPDDASIEGWVVRNNTMFSVKMLLQNEALARLDRGRNVMCLPIPAGRRIWGALTIEEMPFEKYNLYAERLLLVIMALARPMLERGIEFDSIVHQEDIHPVTGLASFAQFRVMLEREISAGEAESATLAIVIVEITNFPDLVERGGRQEAFRITAQLAELARGLTSGQARAFHYKAEEQIALVCPTLDADGASLFALGLLGKVNEEEWKIADERAPLDITLGFAARADGRQSADEMMEAAENLLAMQRV